MTKRQLALLERLEVWFDEHPHTTPLDAAREMRMPPEAAQAVVNLGVSAGSFILVGGEVYTSRAFHALVAVLTERFGATSFQPREMREVLGEGRVWVDRFADVLSHKGLLERFPGGWRLQKGEERALDRRVP
jgi:hypothetical protein